MSSNTPTRYLEQRITGRRYVWTELLAVRSDMSEVGADSTPVITLPEDRPATGLEPEAPPPADDPLDERTIADLQRARILAFEDKAALEAYGRTFSVELKRSKSLQNMQNDLLTALGLND